MEPKIRVVIKNRVADLFDGNVVSLTTYNDLGIFDVLPLHENFISIIYNKIIIDDGKKHQEFKVKQGILRVKENEARIYLDI